MGKHEDADLILKLYDLRRETVMREARNWLFTFNPTSVEDVMATMMGEHSGHFRMVVSYWDMACAMVTNGAIDEEFFNQTNGEHIFVYMKVEPVLEAVRQMFDNPNFCKNLETVVKRIRHEPDPTIMRIVEGWPRNFAPERALALGFRAEQSFEDIVRIHIADELGGTWVK